MKEMIILSVDEIELITKSLLELTENLESITHNKLSERIDFIVERILYSTKQIRDEIDLEKEVKDELGLRTRSYKA